MQFQYLGPRMQGAQTTFQQWGITPQSSNQFWNPNDVVKFMGNITQGLVDPYRSHIQFVVEVDDQIGGKIIDNSAQSLINQTVLLSRQVQIQRIQDYDTLAAGLSDLGFSQYVAQSRHGQGLGFSNIPTNLNSVSSNTSVGRSMYSLKGSQSLYAMQTGNPGAYMPTICGQGSFWAPVDVNDNTKQSASNNVGSGLDGGSYPSISNYISFPFNDKSCDQYTKFAGRALGIRSQYYLGMTQNGYPSAPWSYNQTTPFVKNQDWVYTNMQTRGYIPGRPYQISLKYPSNDPNGFYVDNALSPLNYANICGVAGYTKPIQPQFCRSGNQPMLSSTIPQVQMVQGQILPQPIPRAKKTFRIPLISAIVGILIPPDQFQLIPAASLRDIILQITLNPYAFFTTGYSDVHQLDQVGMQYMQKRQWKIQGLQWVWHLYTFNSAQISAQIKNKLYQGISFTTNYWGLSAQYQLPNGSYVRNTFQIPTNVMCLAQIIIIFLSNQFQTKTFCRKQFRLSNNITSMQIKAGGQYYPLQPIMGNSGNPQDVGTSGDNWNYYQLILLSNNFLFNTNIPAPRINQKNFAINGRIYDTSKKTSLLPTSLYNINKDTGKTSEQAYNQYIGSFSNPDWKKINTDTAMGMSAFHQNRYIGKALYTWSFEPYGHSKGFINGIDTRDFRQFDVTFNCSPTNTYPQDQTMYIYTRSVAQVRLRDGYIQVLGV